MNKGLQNKKIAIVADWISDWGGAEIVISQLMELFPQADIFTSVFHQSENPLFSNYQIVPSGASKKDNGQPAIFTSSIQKIPYLNTKHKLALTLRPQAFEGFDVSQYDIILASTSAESKGIISKPDTLFISYCHTPTRYFWSHYEQYKNMLEFGILNPLAKLVFPRLINKLRKWDYIAAQRPDYFLANSQNTAERIKKYYHRESDVLYPALDMSNIPFSAEKEEYYFYAGRVIPYKKFDLIVETFNTNGLPLKIVANTKNKLSEELRKKSKSNIEWIYETDNTKINALHAGAKAFLFPPEEDFGLVPIAAQATWTPVIAYGKWGALETVWEGKTGIFFEQQTPESLQKAINQFESMTFDASAIRQHAEQFDKKIFAQSLVKFIEERVH